MIQNFIHDHLVRRHHAKRFDWMISPLLRSVQCITTREEAEQRLRELLRKVCARPVSVRVKGEPDILGFKKDCAERMLTGLVDGVPPSSEMSLLKAAANMASVAPDDWQAYEAYLLAFWLVNHQTILALRNFTTSPYIVLHMTCVSRLDRAKESQASFDEQDTSSQLCHIHLVGNGRCYAFDPETGVLEVPAADSYEHLPSKVFAAYAMLALCFENAVVLKVDDDHRLQSLSALLGRMASISSRKKPTQEGTLYEMSIPSGHLRGWHFGKCQDMELNSTPIAFPAPPAWVTGEHGYLLNAKALIFCAWASLFYSSWLASIAYEDIALGDVFDRLSVRLVGAPLVGSCLAAKAAY